MWASTARSVCGSLFAPDLLDQRAPAHHAARLRDQQREQLELGGREIEPLARHFGAAARDVDRDAPGRRGAGRPASPRCEAAQHRRHARRQLGRVERLGQEVVGARPRRRARDRSRSPAPKPGSPACARAPASRGSAGTGPGPRDRPGSCRAGSRPGARAWPRAAPRARSATSRHCEPRRGQDRGDPLARVGVAVDQQHPLRSFHTGRTPRSARPRGSPEHPQPTRVFVTGA